MANLQELKQAEKKLARRSNKVQTSSGYEPIGTAVLGLIEAVQNSPVLKEIAVQLYVIEDGPSVAEWESTSQGGWLIAPVQRNKKARLCYEILSSYLVRVGDPEYDFNRGICHYGMKISRESKFDVSAREFVDNFVDPFVEYLDEELETRIESEEGLYDNVVQPNPANKRNVFVVHGRDLKTRDAVVEYLDSIGLKPLTFDDARALMDEGSPTILRVVSKGIEESWAVVVLITPDDVARLREESEEAARRQARPNVIFEAGVAFGRYPKRTVLVEYNEPSLFSDIYGHFVVRLREGESGIEGFESLGKQLKTVGCAVVF